MFVDELILNFKAGNGGAGVISFRKEKYIPFGGPDGGNGGKGGNVIIRADKKLDSLSHIKKMGILIGENGRPGSGGKRHGRNGSGLIIGVPVGTYVRKNQKEGIDLDFDGKEVIIGKGGMGGCGNAVFTTAVNRTPRVAQKGEEGEEGVVHLEVSLAADVGIIGMPNTGKTTLLNRLTGVQAKIAEYPFTTREVIKGVYEKGGKFYLIIETPGIVEGSYLGKGLGLKFLRHIKKAGVLIHLVDGSKEDIAHDIDEVNKELSLYESQLMDKPQIIAINKIDLPEVKDRVEKIKKELGSHQRVIYFISALKGDGLENLMEGALKFLQREEIKKEEKSTIILVPEQKYKNNVYRKKDILIIEAPELEGILKRMDILNRDAQDYLRRQFVRAGIVRLLKKEGIKVGDRVRCGGVEWEWQWPLK